MNDSSSNISQALKESGERIGEHLSEAGKAVSGEITDTVGNMSRSVTRFTVFLV